MTLQKLSWNSQPLISYPPPCRPDIAFADDTARVAWSAVSACLPRRREGNGESCDTERAHLAVAEHSRRERGQRALARPGDQVLVNVAAARLRIGFADAEAICNLLADGGARLEASSGCRPFVERLRLRLVRRWDGVRFDPFDGPLLGGAGTDDQSVWQRSRLCNRCQLLPVNLLQYHWLLRSSFGHGSPP
jgi:hypothetical protein